MVNLPIIPLKIKVALLLILGAVLAGTIWHYKHTLAKNERLTAALAEERTQFAACRQSHAINQKVSNDYQSQISSLSRRLADARRVFDNAVCVPVQSASRPDATAAAGQLLRPHGVMAESLLEFAAECERERLKLIGLQTYIREVQKKPAD